ncbi:MAG: esterase-like activity of phytase family protein [Gammaproteobacteria bacterium]|nr:esterase-like activity of phytase family protein [Gammaproteobacteria bacterium]
MRGDFSATAAVVASALLTACGDGGGRDAPASNSPPPLSGVNVDFSMAGVLYSTPSVSGTTSSTGGYTYRCDPSCETVTFAVGPITIGAATGASSLSLKDFQGGIDGGLLSPTTIRRVQFLMAIDGDADAGNGIAVPSGLAPSLANRSLNFNASSFDADLASLVDYLKGDGRLSSSYRAGMQIPSAATARAVAEQAEALARGVLVESPTSASLPVSEVRKYVLRVPDSSLIPYSGSSSSLKTTYPRGLRPALGAGLSFVSGTPSTTLQLRTVTSRGVSVAAPRYSDGVSVRTAEVLLSSSLTSVPSTGTISLTQTAADLSSLIPLKTADGVSYSGRPTPTDASGSDGWRNLDEDLQPRSPEFDQRGLDPSGIVQGDAGTYWACDRRGPFLFQLDAQGQTLQRLGPAGQAGALPDVNQRLPAILESRQPTLGCGGTAVRTTSGEIVFSLGAALNVNGRTANSARLIRLVGFNPRTNIVRQFAMPIRNNEFSLRVLDLESLSEDRILALVRYRESSATGPYRWEIRSIDLSIATEISSRVLTTGPNSGLALEFGSATEIESSGIIPASSSTLVELGALGWVTESVEGLARGNSQTLIVIGQSNGGVTSRIRGGDASLTVAEHQVDRNGLITPRAAGSSTPPVFELSPSAIEARQTLIWLLQLRSPVN